MDDKPTFSVVGLGRVGLSIAAAMAHRGWWVTGVDTDPRTVDLINAGAPPVHEPGLLELLSPGRRLRATTSHLQGVLDADVSYLIVPTPTDGDGAFSLRHLASACRSIGRALRVKDRYHLVVVGSTVLPGSVRHGLLPILE